MKLPAHDPSLAAYITLTALLVITPGASTAMVVQHALAGGRTAGLAAAAGIAVANTTWAVAAGLGITAILSRAPLVFAAIQFGGAAYLAFLGVRALLRAWGTRASAALPLNQAATEPDVLPAFRDGIAVNLLNPPVATFYLVIVPSFMPVAAPGRFALLAAIHVGMALFFHAIWAIGFDTLRTVWARPGTRRIVDAVVGVALLVLAARMLR